MVVGIVIPFKVSETTIVMRNSLIRVKFNYYQTTKMRSHIRNKRGSFAINTNFVQKKKSSLKTRTHGNVIWAKLVTGFSNLY